VRAQSNAAFEQGVKAFQAGRIAEALAFFRESYRLLPRAAPLYNIAQCELGLDHPIEAIEALKMYASSGGTNPINEFFLEAEKKTARLRLKIEPADATVSIDGKEGPKGSTEWRLNPGAHVLEIQAQGYHPSTQRIELERGASRELTVTLERTAAPAASPAPPEPPSVPPATAAPPPTAAPIPAATEPRRSGAFWATASTSAALLLTGTITGVIALRNASTYNAQPDNQKDASLRASGETLRVVADLSFGLAIVSGVGAYLLSKSKPVATTCNAWPLVAATPAGGWLGVGGRY
jgi:hypothetical protein